MEKRRVGVILLLYLMCAVLSAHASATQTGVNVNERAELLDINLIARTQTHWVRAFLTVSPFMEGRRNLATDPKFAQFKKAAEAGYNTILSLKHNFYSYEGTNKRLPRPNSPEETAYFNFITQILQHYAKYASIIVLGNEPNIETMPDDKVYDKELGGYPMAIFYQRLTNVVYTYLQEHPELGNPPLYLGAFTGLQIPATQSAGPIQELIKFAASDNRIAGIDIHPHVDNLAQVETQLQFVRRYTTKPIISTEFSLVFRYQKHNTERLGVNAVGRAFAEKYGLNPDMQVYQYLSRLTGNRAPQVQWHDFLKTRDWFDPSFISKVYALFDKYGVAVATYAFTTGTDGAVSFAPDFVPWLLNNLYVPRLADTENGEAATNYGFFNDFVDLSQSTYALATVLGQQIRLGTAKTTYEVELPYGWDKAPEVQVSPLNETGSNQAQALQKEFRIHQADSLPGQTKIETYAETGTPVHTAVIQLRTADKPSLQVSWRKIVFGATGQGSAMLRGDQPLSIASTSPAEVFAGISVELVPIAEGERLTALAQTIFVGETLPQNVSIHSSQFDDGGYELRVYMKMKDGSSFMEGYAVVLDNWSIIVDELEPDQDSGWFGALKKRQTVLESNGWESSSAPAEALFGDSTRLVTRSTEPQLLVWEGEALYSFALTLYTRDVSVVEQSVTVSQATDREHWQAVTCDVTEAGSDAQGWHKVVLSGRLGQESPVRQLRVLVDAAKLPIGAVQLGQLELVSTVN